MDIDILDLDMLLDAFTEKKRQGKSQHVEYI